MRRFYSYDIIMRAKRTQTYAQNTHSAACPYARSACECVRACTPPPSSSFRSFRSLSSNNDDDTARQVPIIIIRIRARLCRVHSRPFLADCTPGPVFVLCADLGRPTDRLRCAVRPPAAYRTRTACKNRPRSPAPRVRCSSGPCVVPCARRPPSRIVAEPVRANIRRRRESVPSASRRQDKDKDYNNKNNTNAVASRSAVP